MELTPEQQEKIEQRIESIQERLTRLSEDEVERRALLNETLENYRHLLAKATGQEA